MLGVFDLISFAEHHENDIKSHLRMAPLELKSTNILHEMNPKTREMSLCEKSIHILMFLNPQVIFMKINVFVCVT